jgi:Fe-S-cluster-containing dehydrogenase component
MATRCVDYCPTEALKVRLNGGVTWERDICICCHACEDNCFAHGIEVHDTN